LAPLARSTAPAASFVRISRTHGRRPIQLRPPPGARAFVRVSVMLQQLYKEAPGDYVTLGWLMGRLRKHFFGMIMVWETVLGGNRLIR
jgi:hypothetical protein